MNQTANAKMVTRLLFRLLPVQVLLAAVGAVNGIVSSFFASNYVGIKAMSAIGLYSPLGLLISSVSAILVGGSSILCGEYMWQNQQDKLQNVFSLNLILSALIAMLFVLLYGLLAILDLTGFLTGDATVRPFFNRYLLGQAIGILPLMMGNSFAAFLSLENKGRLTLTASLIYIVVNLLLNYLFVRVLHLEAFGLALAASLGMWVFMGVQGQYYLSGNSHLRFRASRLAWRECGQIVRIGVPGALSNIYQTARGLIVNRLLEVYVGSVAISAFATANNFLGIAWAVPVGMLAVSRMLISVSIGEEDRQTLADSIRVMFRRFLPL